jgi:threonine dehydrogenase-like Zn-dependent dehydrogenase
MLPRRHGRLCVFGVPHEEEQLFPWNHVTGHELRFVISRNTVAAIAYYRQAVDMVAGDWAELGEMVTPVLPYTQAARAFEMYAEPETSRDSIKVTLAF